MSTRETRMAPKRWRVAVASAGLGLLAMLGLSGGAALAGPMSGVDVVVHVGDTETPAAGDPPTACTFHLHFQSTSAKAGFFDIHAGTIDGAVVESGTFDTSATGDSRAPASGVFTLDEGTYVIEWDDEFEQDPSFDSLTIEVVCEEASPTPTPTPSPTGSELPIESESPSPTPTGSELPIESTAPTPTGSELPIGGGQPTGGVGGVTATPPPTDTTMETTTGGNAILPLAAMLGLTGLLAVWAIRQRNVPATRRIRVPRQRD